MIYIQTGLWLTLKCLQNQWEPSTKQIQLMGTHID